LLLLYLFVLFNLPHWVTFHVLKSKNASKKRKCVIFVLCWHHFVAIQLTFFFKVCFIFLRSIRPLFVNFKTFFFCFIFMNSNSPKMSKRKIIFGEQWFPNHNKKQQLWIINTTCLCFVFWKLNFSCIYEIKKENCWGEKATCMKETLVYCNRISLSHWF